MKRKLFKWWIIVVVLIPFILMICLHIGIALGNYFGVNINVPNVDASTWLIFSSSYLGGCMTLTGVMITLRHERSIQQYEKMLESIQNEKEKLGKAICELNTFAPNTIYQRFNSLYIAQTGYNPEDIASIRYQLAEEQRKINSAKIETMTYTDIYSMSAECSICKKACRMQAILPEFQKVYDKVGNYIFKVLQMIDSYVVDAERNALYNSLIQNYKNINEQCQNIGKPLKYSELEIKEFEEKIIDVKPKQDEIIAGIIEISNYNQNEIQQLIALTREYIAIKQKNAYKKCFVKEQEA